MSRPLRFCMVTTFYPPYNFGGDGIFVQRLSNQLAQRGHSVDVVHCIDAYEALVGRKQRPAYDDHPNVTVHGLKSVYGILSPLITHQTGRPALKSTRLREILEQDFDVIHFHNISLIGGPDIYTYGTGIKFHTLHEFFLVCPTHVLFRFNREPCTKQDCVSCTLSYRRPPQWWRYSRLIEDSVRHVDAFIAPSDIHEEIHRRRGYSLPIVNLPNFVPEPDVRVLPQSTSSPRPEDPYFLFVGRLEKIKGLQNVIPMFRDHPKAKLIVAGSGSHDGRLRRMAAGSSNIQFLGHVGQPRLQELYRNAVAVIVPSICYEVFPTVIIEAFSQQTPAIVNNLGGMPGMIELGGGGLVYNDQQELVEAVDRLVTDEPYRQLLGGAGYDTYLHEWTPDVHLERYLSLIDEFIAEKQGPGRDQRLTVGAM